MADYDWFNHTPKPRYDNSEQGTKFRWLNTKDIESEYTSPDGQGGVKAEILAREAWALEARVHDLENVVAKLSEDLYNRPANIPVIGGGQIYVGDVPPSTTTVPSVTTGTTTTMVIPRNPEDVARIADLESQVISLTQDYEEAARELEVLQDQNDDLQADLREANGKVEVLGARIANARDYLDD